MTSSSVHPPCWLLYQAPPVLIVENGNLEWILTLLSCSHYPVAAWYPGNAKVNLHLRVEVG